MTARKYNDDLNTIIKSNDNLDISKAATETVCKSSNDTPKDVSTTTTRRKISFPPFSREPTEIPATTTIFEPTKLNAKITYTRFEVTELVVTTITTAVTANPYNQDNCKLSTKTILNHIVPKITNVNPWEVSIQNPRLDEAKIRAIYGRRERGNL